MDIKSLRCKTPAVCITSLDFQERQEKLITRITDQRNAAREQLAELMKRSSHHAAEIKLWRMVTFGSVLWALIMTASNAGWVK